MKVSKYSSIQFLCELNDIVRLDSHKNIFKKQYYNSHYH